MHHPGAVVRTTLDIDDDLMAVAKELARRERSSAGKVVSRLLHQSLTSTRPAAPKAPRGARSVAGFDPFPARPGVVVTDEDVNALREAEGI
jgi:hypothetical protein